MRLSSYFLNALVFSALVSACSEPEPVDYGPPPTCLADEEGRGHWEYLPTPIHEPDLLDENPEPAGPITPSSGTMVWTGSRVLFWGGGKGASFDPETKQWEALPTEGGPPFGNVSVWTGTRWIVVGGNVESGLIGAMYDPEAETWEAIPMAGAPVAGDIEAIWTGSEMIVWGAAESAEARCFHRAGLFDPATGSWRSISFEETPFADPWPPKTYDLAPSLCQPPPAAKRGPLIWTGQELVVWLANDENDAQEAGVYNPISNLWHTIDLTGGPLPRWQAYWAWTGSEILVWGGRIPDSNTGRGVVTGELFDLSTGNWRQMSSVNAPDGMNARSQALWTGHELVVPAAEDGCPVGARYDLATDTWSAMARSPGEFHDRYGAQVLWTGSAAMLWGGYGHLLNFDDGALYYP